MIAFDNLKIEMNELAVDLDQQLSDKQSLILQQKQDHKQKVNDLTNQEYKLKLQAKSLKEKENATRDKLNLAMRSLEQQKLKVEDLVKKKQSLVDTKQDLESQIKQLETAIDQGTRELNKSNDNMLLQMNKNLVELNKYEIYTGLKIEVQSNELMCFKFFNLDPNDYDREFAITLNIGGSTYSIENTSPKLSDETVEQIQGKLNQGRQLSKFLKEVRTLFKDFVQY